MLCLAGTNAYFTTLLVTVFVTPLVTNRRSQYETATTEQSYNPCKYFHLSFSSG